MESTTKTIAAAIVRENRMTRTAAALIALALATAASTARAGDDTINPIDERVRLSLGAAVYTATTTLQLDGSAGTAGTYLSAEDDLGLQRTKFEPMFEIMLRAGKMHRVSFDYFSLNRDATRVLARSPAAGPIVFRDATLQNGDPVQTDLELRSFGITYGYSFWRTDKLELAGTFSVHEIDISARARVQTQTRHIDQSENLAGPFPTLGIDATWVASRRFYFEGRAQYMKLSVDHLQGALGIYELNALYRYRPNVSFALGYHEVRANLNSRQAGNAGLFDFLARGPQLFVRIAF